MPDILKYLIRLYFKSTTFLIGVYRAYCLTDILTNLYNIILINIMEDLVSSKTGNEFKVMNKDNQIKRKKKYGCII